MKLNLREYTPEEIRKECDRLGGESLKCLDENNYDKSRCKQAFENFKECKRLYVSYLFTGLNENSFDIAYKNPTDWGELVAQTHR
jgi:hypothetical protein